MRITAALIVSVCTTLAVPVWASQVTGTSDSAPQQSTYQGSVEPMKDTPTFKVNVVTRSINAVNYRHRSGSTEVDFGGTSLTPEVKGRAKVDSEKGRMEIDARLENLKPASFFGPEYLTYVLWAITPEGRTVSLGEIIPNNSGDARLRVTTDLQAFGLMVTAEPYFAVTRPGDLIIAENQVRRDTKGWEQPVTARFDALERGQYTVDLNAAQLPATSADRKRYRSDMLQAMNAVAIAEAAGAQKFAPEVLTRAKDFLARGEDYVERDQSDSAIGTVARGAAQAAEEARVLSIRRRQEQELAEQRRLQQQRVEEARLKAQQEAERASQAQQQAQQAQQERLAAERAQQEARAAAEEAARQRAEAEAARQAALLQQQQLAAQAQQAEQARIQAEQARLQAEQQAKETRGRLMQQLNQVLQTRDSARGLILNMSDVLFDLDKATLRPAARERLAKVAGIILAYPDLELQIEGHTDSTGPEEYNQNLSERRAAAVRDYLISQGVDINNIVSQGFGELKPLTTNDTAAGRQQNRRVELVVSGEAIESAQTEQPGMNGNAQQGGAAASTQSAPAAGTQSAPAAGTQSAPAASTESAPMAPASSPQPIAAPTGATPQSNTTPPASPQQ